MKLKSFIFLASLFAAALGLTSALADTSKTVAPGAQVTFSLINVTGTQPLSYQWKKNGVNIPGATASTYVIPSVAATDTGVYVCVISNVAGSAPTDNGNFTVAALPSGQILISSP